MLSRVRSLGRFAIALLLSQLAATVHTPGDEDESRRSRSMLDYLPFIHWIAVGTIPKRSSSKYSGLIATTIMATLRMNRPRKNAGSFLVVRLFTFLKKRTDSDLRGYCIIIAPCLLTDIIKVLSSGATVVRLGFHELVNLLGVETGIMQSPIS